MDKDREEKQATVAADLAAREKMLDNRASWLNAHDDAVAKRDSAIADREEIVRLKEAELEARREADTARAERERLLVQIREVNEKLVIASLPRSSWRTQPTTTQNGSDRWCRRRRRSYGARPRMAASRSIAMRGGSSRARTRRRKRGGGWRQFIRSIERVFATPGKRQSPRRSPMRASTGSGAGREGLRG